MADDQKGTDTLTPSAKLIYRVLNEKGEMTQKQIICETSMSPKTVRNGLNQLKSLDLVQEDNCSWDARINLYSIEQDIRELN